MSIMAAEIKNNFFHEEKEPENAGTGDLNSDSRI